MPDLDGYTVREAWEAGRHSRPDDVVIIDGKQWRVEVDWWPPEDLNEPPTARLIPVEDE